MIDLYLESRERKLFSANTAFARLSFSTFVYAYCICVLLYNEKMRSGLSLRDPWNHTALIRCRLSTVNSPISTLHRGWVLRASANVIWNCIIFASRFSSYLETTLILRKIFIGRNNSQYLWPNWRFSLAFEISVVRLSLRCLEV